MREVSDILDGHRMAGIALCNAILDKSIKLSVATAPLYWWSDTYTIHSSLLTQSGSHQWIKHSSLFRSGYGWAHHLGAAMTLLCWLSDTPFVFLFLFFVFPLVIICSSCTHIHAYILHISTYDPSLPLCTHIHTHTYTALSNANGMGGWSAEALSCVQPHVHTYTHTVSALIEWASGPCVAHASHSQTLSRIWAKLIMYD